MKYILSLIIVVFTLMSKAYAQDAFEKWDQNYRKIELLNVLNFEQHYADSIDANTTLGKGSYYFRHDKFKFSAKYLGEVREVDSQVMRSMKNVFKRLGGNSELLENDIRNEHLFQVGDIKFWAPIQKQLEKPLRKEIKKGDSVLLYCLFLNEHSSNGLFNSLLISEFKKE